MRSHPTPAAVVFDLYDTLVVVAPAARRAHQQAAAARIGVGLADFLDAWESTSHASSTGQTGPTTVRYRTAIDMLRARGLLGLGGGSVVAGPGGTSATGPGGVPGAGPDEAPSDASLGDDALAADLAELEHTFLRDSVRVVDGVPDLLRALRADGRTTWLLSNCSPSVEHTLAASGLEGLLDGMSLSWQVGAAKPDQALYADALARAQVDPADAVYVADGMVDEHGAALRAGMQAVRVTWSHDEGTAPQGVPAVAAVPELARLLGVEV